MSKHRLWLSFAILTLLFVNGCISISSQSENSKSVLKDSHIYIYLFHDICEGSCPVYSITIYEDGTVFYRGELNVQTTGEVKSYISPSDLQVLVNEILSLDILGHYYATGIKDAATINMHISIDGKHANVENFGYDKRQQNGILTLACHIDEITNSYYWTGKTPIDCDGLNGR